MEVLPLLHFNIVMRCCNLCLLFIVSVACFSSYCGARRPRPWPPPEPFICGGRQFEDPFGARNRGHGDPLLQLRCDKYNDMYMPMLDIKGTQYYILQPSNFSCNSSLSEGIVMTIVDKNLMGNKCHPSSKSSTMQLWSSNQFHTVDGYKNISLWKGCRNDTPGFLHKASRLRCNASFYFSTSSDMSWTGRCDSQVQLPVRKDFDPEPNMEPNIKQGFKIKWTPSKYCQHCRLDKGMCGYETNTTSNQFLCNHLPDYGPNPRSDKLRTDHGRKSNNAVRIGFSIGGAAVVAVCVSVILIYYLKWRKAETLRCICGINHYHQRTDMEAGIGNLPIFTYEELRQGTNGFHQNKELGDGGFGTVYLGNLKDGRTVAVKRLYQQNSRRMEQFINEGKILSSLHHPNLVQLYGCTFPQSPVLLLVYEFVPNGTLADHLHGSRRTSKGLPWNIRLNIAIQTAQALSFLHSVNPPIFHRDVKSTNILLDEHFRPKVADFGLSRLVPVDVSHVTTAPQGTPGYLDPEYHQCFQLTEKSDVYSFGVVLVELISAKLAVDLTRNRNEIILANTAIEKIGGGALHELVDPDLETETNLEVKAMVSAVAELAFGCLERDRDFRPDMKKVAERLEEIRLFYESSHDSEKQSSVSTDYSTKKPVSPTSMQEEWPSMASERSV